MPTKRQWILLILFVVTLVMRKFGLGFSSFLLTGVSVLICLNILFTSLQFEKLIHRILLAGFVFTGLAFLQTWLPPGFLAFLIFVEWVAFTFFAYKKISNDLPLLLLWIILGFIHFTAILFNPREFHNFYRSNTYEDFIRSKYPEQQGIVADMFINKYKKPEKEKAEKYFNDALLADSLSENDEALKFYNKSIDCDPDNYWSYYKRGLFKLTRLELAVDIANSAVKDFDRSLRLNPYFTYAYYYRGIALGYMNQKGRSFLDFQRVWETDSILSEKDFIQKYGVSKKTFSIPFHP